MGYLTVDHRAGDGKLEEFDTVSCKHCQAVLKVFNRQPSGAWCLKCDGPVCDTRACASVCTPFFQKIEVALSRQRLLASLE